MTRERYNEIMAMRGPFGSLKYAYPKKRYQYDEVGETPVEGGITEAEHAAIMAKWETMSGGSCYMNALQALVCYGWD